MGFVLFDLLTWPLILLGLIRGSYNTYKCLKQDVTNAQKEEQLQYWVVFCGIIFFFPWFDRILGWFLFGGLIGIMKFILLLMVVVTRSKYGFVYKLIEEQFSSFVEPWVQKSLKFTEVFRTQVCNFTLVFLTSTHQSLISLLLNETSNECCRLLKNNLNKTIEIIKREETKRDKKKDRSHNDDNNVDDNKKSKKYDEQLKHSSNENEKQENSLKQQNITTSQ